MNEVDRLCGKIIGACIEVHKFLGPGLMERVYQQCLCRELNLQGLKFQTEVPVQLNYKGVELDVTLRADIMVEDMVLVEIKAVNEWNAVYEAQLISYLKLANKPAGLLINFNVPILKDGIKRLFNGMF
jgi:GxxExxY protein